MSGERALRIEFGGWFMCRLATDPDPTDEPRGASGSTFALAGEPDLDRVIVLHDPPPGTVRSHAPDVGVYVTRAAVAGTDLPDGLVGGRVELLDRPRFENRNFVLNVAGQEPIVPFRLRVGGSDGKPRLERTMVMAPEDPDADVHSLPQSLLQEYGGRSFRTDPELVASATGIHDPYADRVRRRAELVAELDGPGLSRVRRAALGKRIRELDIALKNPADERVVNMTAVEEFDFPLCGTPVLHGELPGGLRPDLDAPWRVTFWMGGWDPDVLCGFMRGDLTVPLRN
ncbi:hypothetical protein [Streptomyces ipomoeae]|uniref:hypothetical protein n=1 Tax=Streptomyces ipomoeae TaxID=103232 RepID=UPI001146DBE0|nr:hypothetical protein [Streptomyces ipomoeae]MDX2938359.1 hypothetical protein [Streptomyces ipomoeae]TQE22063.1 hypothetical protein SipoB123_24525 [Streptomyces ipomoeae]